MKTLAIKKEKGFSLIEMIVYISILAFMLIIVTEVIYSINSSQRVMRAVRDIESSALISLDRIGREVRGATSINVASSTLGTNPGVLVLNSTDGSGAARVVRFYLSSGRVRMSENGVDAGALTESSATTTSLIFRRFATSTAEGIRIGVALESGTSTYYRTENFYSSLLIR